MCYSELLDTATTNGEHIMYTAPSNIKESYARWDYSADTTTPAHDAMKTAIGKALDAGVFYSVDMANVVAEALCVTQEQRDADIVPGKARCVEGGPFAMEVYLARKVVEAERFAIKDAVQRDKMSLVVGQKVGKLYLNDGKYAMGAVVDSLTDKSVTLRASRGAQKIVFKCTYIALQSYIDRAKK